MGSCWAKYACDYAESMIGAVCGGKGVYSDIVGEMDSISFYNYPKNGEANSCKIFVDNCILHACTDPSYDEDPEGAKWTALYMVNEPQAAGANDGAGCAQSVRMYQAMDAWYEDNFERGDEIYYRRNSAVSSSNPLGVYHTGIIVGWGAYDELDGKDGYKVVEGNTTYEGESGRVGVRYIAFGDSRIAGAGRPRYDGWEEGTEDNGSNGNEKENTGSHVLTDAVIEDLARRCIEGEFGNFPLRKQKINALGYGPIYSKVQSRVNMIVYGR